MHIPYEKRSANLRGGKQASDIKKEEVGSLLLRTGNATVRFAFARAWFKAIV